VFRLSSAKQKQEKKENSKHHKLDATQDYFGLIIEHDRLAKGSVFHG